MGVRVVHGKHSWTHVARWLTSIAWPARCLFVEGPTPGVDWTQMVISSLCSGCLVGEMCVEFETWSGLLWASVSVRVVHGEHSWTHDVFVMFISGLTDWPFLWPN